MVYNKNEAATLNSAFLVNAAWLTALIGRILNYRVFFSIVPVIVLMVSAHTSGFHVHMPSIISSR